jgi:hypothetical protein
MTPKEKADSLFNKYYQYDITIIGIESQFEERGICLYDAKQLALIAVDEVIENLVELSNGEFTFIHNVEYWQQVKQEIQAI